MEKAPKSLRLHIGLFGRTNVGKSSFLNMVAGQDVAITSPIPGTTTDVVEKTMEHFDEKNIRLESGINLKLWHFRKRTQDMIRCELY